MYFESLFSVLLLLPAETKYMSHSPTTIKRDNSAVMFSQCRLCRLVTSLATCAHCLSTTTLSAVKPL